MLLAPAVSILILIIWAVFYLIKRKKIYSAKIYFALLLLMGCAGILINPLPLMGLEPTFYKLENIVLFALLMVVIIIPWLQFDKYVDKSYVFIVREEYIQPIKIIFFCTILISLFSIIYTIPYAVTAYSIGLDTVRNMGSDALLPHSVFTTIAVGFASITPIIVLFVYISLLDKRLRHYSIWLVLSSFSYIVSTTSMAARDGYVFIALAYLCFYLIFRKSYDGKLKKTINKYLLIGIAVLGIGIGMITVERFLNQSTSKEEKIEEAIYGTWGYFYQQPYVFDHIIEDFNRFYGFKRRLKFLDGVIETKVSHEYDSGSALRAEYMFGTQFAEFYEIAGYSSLLIITFLYVLFFSTGIRYHIRHKNYFSLLLAFCIYFHLTISGMFYFRFGGNDNVFFLYLLLFVSFFFMPSVLKVNITTE